jgi:hypothetical protein
MRLDAPAADAPISVDVTEAHHTAFGECLLERGQKGWIDDLDSEWAYMVKHTTGGRESMGAVRRCDVEFDGRARVMRTLVMRRKFKALRRRVLAQLKALAEGNALY